MFSQRIPRTPVIGPDGNVLTLESLPPPDTSRWVSRRKAEVVVAVNGGLLSLQEACERYGLSHEEFFAWERAFKRMGMQGLRATGPTGGKRHIDDAGAKKTAAPANRFVNTLNG